MHSLRETQRAFRDAFLRGEFDAAAAMIETDGLAAEERLAIYRNNVRIGFRTTLEAEFPIVRQLGGDDWFTGIAQTYHRHFPSRAGNLHFVGQHFAAFLREQLQATAFEYFADVAALEWAYQEALVAAEHAPLMIERLQTVAPEDYGHLHFRLHPAAQLIASEYPILSLWQAHRSTDLTSAPNVSAIDLLNHPQNVLLTRCATHVELRALPDSEFAFLNACTHAAHTSGNSLETAVAVACACDPHFDLTQTLVRYVQLGVVVDFDILTVR